MGRYGLVTSYNGCNLINSDNASYSVFTMVSASCSTTASYGVPVVQIAFMLVVALTQLLVVTLKIAQISNIRANSGFTNYTNFSVFRGLPFKIGAQLIHEFVKKKQQNGAK